MNGNQRTGGRMRAGVLSGLLVVGLAADGGAQLALRTIGESFASNLSTRGRSHGVCEP